MAARSVLTVNWQQDGKPMCYSTEEVAVVPRAGEPLRIMEAVDGKREVLVAGVVRTIGWIYSERQSDFGHDTHNCVVTLAAHPTHPTQNVDASCEGCQKALPVDELSWDREGGNPLCITCLAFTWRG